MGIFDRFRKPPVLTNDQLEEAISAFAKKGDSAMSDALLRARQGEGIEDLALADAYGTTSLGSFNLFYNKYINKAYANEVAKIEEYRRMSKMPEIADVLEDAVNEATQDDEEGRFLRLDIVDDELANNQNVVKNLNDEFEKLFYNRIDIGGLVGDFFRTYFVDGRLFYERIIQQGKPSLGIMAIKKLPTLTMDFDYDRKTGKTLNYYQYTIIQGRDLKK